MTWTQIIDIGYPLVMSCLTLYLLWKLQMLREDFEQRLRDARESFSGDYYRLSEKYYELQRRQYSGFKALGLVYEAPSRTEGHWRVQREKEIGQ